MTTNSESEWSMMRQTAALALRLDVPRFMGFVCRSAATCANVTQIKPQWRNLKRSLAKLPPFLSQMHSKRRHYLPNRRVWCHKIRVQFLRAFNNTGPIFKSRLHTPIPWNVADNWSIFQYLLRSLSLISVSLMLGSKEQFYSPLEIGLLREPFSTERISWTNFFYVYGNRSLTMQIKGIR